MSVIAIVCHSLGRAYGLRVQISQIIDENGERTYNDERQHYKETSSKDKPGSFSQGVKHGGRRKAIVLCHVFLSQKYKRVFRNLRTSVRTTLLGRYTASFLAVFM